MFEQLDDIEKRYEQLNEKMSDPAVYGNPAEYQKYAREHAELSDIVSEYREWKRADRQLQENRKVLEEESDRELIEMAREEVESLSHRKEVHEEQLKLMLLPKDPRDEKSVIIEIRAGTGGDEAGLFAADLFRMYSRYAEDRRWKMEVLSSNATGVGGYKEIVCNIQGKGAYSRLKYEAGTHRVQRVPATETQGRIHTSAVTVAILPEAEEVDVQINPNDLKIDVYRSSGPGGQSVNTTDSAVRITHVPSGIVVTCQDEKSQHKNKEKALKVLRARLFEEEQRRQQEAYAQNRKTQIGSGDRSERIRTYNYPQERVTDHRIGLTLHKLTQILEGDLDELIDKLVYHYQTEALQKSGAS
ncbi:peptide chain release factor 1 [Nitrospina gracilis]|uniref:peptide chain release factor 1 n=1 Tax=Nitrospina gracilis TaxID=35801 RepID=UPI001F017999|nr:peptide chain release factor 1 [Nitrospina gracilis]MCF8721708.1 peptide chain release factor 1 [Nitrospina gracilis Nb-211]